MKEWIRYTRVKLRRSEIAVKGCEVTSTRKLTCLELTTWSIKEHL
jgi:hypothetical protein